MPMFIPPTGLRQPGRGHPLPRWLCLASLMLAGPALAAPPDYQLSAHIGLGTGKRWDYLSLDAAGRRLYLAHADKVEVVDVQTRSRVGTIAGLHGTHGIATAPALGRGFISDGKGDAVVIFDLRTLAILRTVPVGRNPDAIVFDPVTGRVAAFNGASHDATILDAASGDVVFASIALGGKPEYARVDGGGRAYFNIEDTAEVAVLDLQAGRLLRRYSITPCVEPTGLAITPDGRLISVCRNHLAIISDPAEGKVLATAPIGDRPDGVVVDAGHAYSANGGDGTISIIATDPPTGATAATLASRRTARTIEVDPRTHALYLPALADVPPAGPATAGAADATATDGPRKVQADEIEILVFTPR